MNVFLDFLLALGDGWNNLILQSEEELNFVKNAMSSFYSHYHGKFILGGSTNQNVGSDGSIEFSNYLTDSSGEMSFFLYMVLLHSVSKFFLTWCIFFFLKNNCFDSLSFFPGLYNVYLQPRTDEENLPENASYNANDEILFPSASLLSNAGRLCEKGKFVKCSRSSIC